MVRFINFTVTLVAILAIFPLYTRYKVAAAPVPPGVYLAGAELSALKEPDEIRQHLARIYDDPIAVYYADQRLILPPEEVGFTIDVDQMVAEASQYLEGTAFVEIALRQALGFDQRRRDVPIRFLLDTDKLRNWLSAAALEYNRGPQSPRLLPPTERRGYGDAPSDASGSDLPPNFGGVYRPDWTWTIGAPGYTLDVEASIPPIVAALKSDTARSAKLVLAETPPLSPTMDDLARALDNMLSTFPGFAAVYVHDLANQAEAHVDTEVAFSGMSTLKIVIISAVMQRMAGIQADDPRSYEIGQWIDFALGESNNYAANLLVRWLGDGDITTGTRRVTEFARQLGLASTYMQSGYDAKVQLAEIPTPGNQRTDWDADPDSNLQSTPADMGRILSAIYDCTQGEGLLIETFGDDFTPDECAAILFYMGHDEFQEMLWGGLPNIQDAWIVHKHGFAFESHSDVALVWGPTGPYVISMFLFRRGWLDWETSNSSFKAVSRIIWNFFKFQQQQLDIERPTALELAPPPGYVPLNNFVPATE